MFPRSIVSSGFRLFSCSLTLSKPACSRELFCKLLIPDRWCVSPLVVDRGIVTTCSACSGFKIKVRDPRRFNPKSQKKQVKVWLGMSIADLAASMDRTVDHVFDCLLHTEYADLYESPDETIQDMQLLVRLAQLSGMRCDVVARPSSGLSVTGLLNSNLEMPDRDVYRRSPPTDKSLLKPRSPVVTIMGHVDHGKTTLLDALRHSNIVQHEFGAITQHIGAFVVKLPSASVITFLDTPGHAAFKKMRARGAKATDIVVLVVAADDGVMDQTIESIHFAKQAGVPFVVAINKCDKTVLNIDKTKRQLLKHDVILEEFGGDVQAVCISALKKVNLDSLNDAILAQAAVMDLRADYTGPVEGVIIESKTVPGKGKVCSLLVQQGTLKKGSVLVAGTSYCKSRALFNEHGNLVSEVPPSFPVEVMGWKELPSAGDEVLEVESENRAKEVVLLRKDKEMNKKAMEDQKIIEKRRKADREQYVSQRMERLQAGFLRRDPRKKVQRTKEAVDVREGPKFAIIVKADVDGSLEAITDVFSSYSSEKCWFDMVSFGIGPMTEGDVEMAETFNAIIYCFNTPEAPAVEKLAKGKQVQIRNFNVIYRLVEDWKKELNKQLPLVPKETLVGEGVILKEFLVTEKGKQVPVAGCRVTKGTLKKSCFIRFLRNGELFYDGKVTSMKKEKEAVSSGGVNEEVGLMLEDSGIRFQADDEVQCYEMYEEPQEIDWFPPGF